MSRATPTRRLGGGGWWAAPGCSASPTGPTSCACGSPTCSAGPEVAARVLSASGLEAVAHAPDRHYPAGPVRVGLDLAADAPDVLGDGRLVLPLRARRPYLFEK